MANRSCGKPVEVFVPRGFHGKLVMYKCGSIGVDGYPVLCGGCEHSFSAAEYRLDVEECGERVEDDY